MILPPTAYPQRLHTDHYHSITELTRPREVPVNQTIIP
jgi:hypothetical protein